MSRPNILFITTDMHRYDALACNGNPHIRTPCIDALAGEGVRFSRAFTNSPVCMPSRATLFTGRLPSSHGVRWNQGGLRSDEVTIPRLLQSDGYQTAAIGKMHWGDTSADLGIDYVNVLDHGGQRTTGAGPTYQERMREWYGDSPPDVEQDPEYLPSYGAVASPLPMERHVDAFVAQATKEFLGSREESRPFFCWTSFPGPHLPLDPVPPWDSFYDVSTIPLPDVDPTELDGKPPEQRAFQQSAMRGNGFGDYREITRDEVALRRFIAHYWGKISMIDHLVGELVEEVKRLSPGRETVVILSSDHGDFAGHHDLLFKQDFMYDDLLHVPLIVWGPQRWRPGTIDALVESVDIPATILDIAGVSGDSLQGRSLVPLLDGRTHRHRDSLYAEGVYRRMLRTEEWKLVHYEDRDYGELYHLAQDPGELINLYQDPAHADRRAALYRALVDRLMSVDESDHGPIESVELPHPDDALGGAVVRLPRL